MDGEEPRTLRPQPGGNKRHVDVLNLVKPSPIDVRFTSARLEKMKKQNATGQWGSDMPVAALPARTRIP